MDSDPEAPAEFEAPKEVDPESVEPVVPEVVEPDEGDNPTAQVTMAHEGVNTSDFWTSREDEDYKVTTIGKTPGGREVQVKRREVGNGYYVEMRGGKNPKAFEGWHTSYSRAEQEARLYLNKKWEQHGQSGSNEAAA